MNTAFAMDVAGDRVGVYLDRSPHLFVNGTSAALDDASISLPNGGTVWEVGATTPKFLVEWPSGFVSGVTVRSSYMDIGVNRPVELDGSFEGLLGNLNGIAFDGAFVRGGETLTGRIPFRTLYGEFGNSWRIAQDESLFDYENGNTTETFTLLGFPRGSFTTADLESTVYDAARLICEAAGITDPVLLEDCILDVALTGDREFVHAGIDTSDPDTVFTLSR